jgi:hypothetical protein
MKQSRLTFEPRPAVTTQFWAMAADPHLAYVVFSRCASRPVDIGRCQVIELGYTIASTGLASMAMYADRP